MLVAGGGVADAAGRESLDMLLALLTVVHVHGSVQDDEDLGALVYVPDVGLVRPVQAHGGIVDLGDVEGAPRAISGEGAGFEEVDVGRSWLDGGLGVVLDGAPDLAGAIWAGQTRDQVQRHVDAGADPGGGDHVAVIDPAVVLARLDAGVKGTQLVKRTPVGGCRATVEQPGCRVDQCASAHAGHQGDRSSLFTHPRQVRWVAQQWAGARSAGVHEHLQRRRPD